MPSLIPSCTIVFTRFTDSGAAAGRDLLYLLKALRQTLTMLVWWWGKTASGDCRLVWIVTESQRSYRGWSHIHIYIYQWMNISILLVVKRPVHKDFKRIVNSPAQTPITFSQVKSWSLQVKSRWFMMKHKHYRNMIGCINKKKILSKCRPKRI